MATSLSRLDLLPPDLRNAIEGIRDEMREVVFSVQLYTAEDWQTIILSCADPTQRVGPYTLTNGLKDVHKNLLHQMGIDSRIHFEPLLHFRERLSVYGKRAGAGVNKADIDPLEKYIARIVGKSGEEVHFMAYVFPQHASHLVSAALGFLVGWYVLSPPTDESYLAIETFKDNIEQYLEVIIHNLVLSHLSYRSTGLDVNNDLLALRAYFTKGWAPSVEQKLN